MNDEEMLKRLEEIESLLIKIVEKVGVDEKYVCPKCATELKKEIIYEVK